MTSAEIFPNANPNEKSPDLNESGIEIHLDQEVYKYPQDKIILRGAFMIDDSLYQSTDGYPPSWLTIVLVRRDLGGGFLKILDNDIHQLTPALVPGVNSGEKFLDIQSDDSVVPHGTSENILHGGYFNIDLAEFAKLPRDQSSYWVEAFIGDHISSRLPFIYLPENSE